LCTLGAQSEGAAERRIQTRSGSLPDRQRNRTEIIYFKLYKGQLAVVERALEIAARMLGSDKSRGYSLEMICADFLAGAALETDKSVEVPEPAAVVDCSVPSAEQILSADGTT
jgi:hypothetical protein